MTKSTHPTIKATRTVFFRKGRCATTRRASRQVVQVGCSALAKSSSIARPNIRESEGFCNKCSSALARYPGRDRAGTCSPGEPWRTARRPSQHFNLVAGADHSGLDDAHADPSVRAEQGAGHPGLRNRLDVGAGRARTVVLEHRVADGKLLAPELVQPHAASDDVPPVLTVANAQVCLRGNLVERLAL